MRSQIGARSPAERIDHLEYPAKPNITRADYGGTDNYKTRLEIIALNRRSQQERITAGELLRSRIAPFSEEMGLAVQCIDEHKPYEALNKDKL